jgi:uncharacterized protein
VLNRLAFALTLAAVIPIPPVPTHYVTDTAGVLSAATIQHLDAELASYHDTTGHRVLVWIGQTTGDDPLEYWTIRAAERWKIGSKQLDDGAILFVFMRDRKLRIEVGYGLESALTDAAASRIIRETIAPQMRAGDVNGAITAGVNRMLLTITPSFGAANQTALPRYQDNPITDMVVVFSVGLFLVLWLAIFVIALLSGHRGRWYSSGGGGWSGGGGLGGGSFSGGGSFGGGGASGGW